MKLLPAILLCMLVIFFACTSTPSIDVAAPTKGNIKAGGFNVYFEQEGAGDAIILLHAGFQDHSMWKEQVNALSKKYKVITIDQPYHGNTTGNDTVTLISDIIRTVLDSLKVEKVSVIGLSMGGASAQDFVLAYPDRINKVILMASGINGYDRDHKIDSVSFEWFQRMVTALEAKDTTEAAKIFTRAWAEGPYRATDSLKSPTSQYVLETTLKNLRQHKFMGWPLYKKIPLAIDQINTINKPVLLIHADKDMPYMMESNIFLEKTIPGAKRVLIKDVAHMLNMEKPEEVNQLILKFLDESAIKK